MDILPSYNEATAGPDWLALVQPFVPTSNWTRCCLVNRRFYQHFAPFLWQDPLMIVRKLGLHPNDDLAWYRRFIQKYAKSSRIETRLMVQCLDFRAFALSASGLYSTEASERAISESFKSLPRLFPRLRCLLLDGHPQLDPGSLAVATPPGSDSLELLDLGQCRQELSPKFLISPLFRALVYLDVSSIPGSLRSAIQSSLNPTYLPELRVLRARAREVDDATAELLFQTFRLQLWSLDLSDNRLTDKSLDAMLHYSFPSLSFHTDAHFEVEGKWALPKDVGSRRYGPFRFIEESRYSSSFTHSERYLADAPVYSRRADQTDLQEWQTVRSDGTRIMRRDDASAVKAMLLDVPSSISSAAAAYSESSIRSQRAGITHLRLNGNALTADGLSRLLRESSGRLEHLECDRCIHNPPNLLNGESKQHAYAEGVLGLTHLLRPVVSSSLRSLRVHHSLVTQVPTVIVDGFPSTTRLRLSEDIFYRNTRRIYPQGFNVDMNPRLDSLTLTNVPARSSGPVIEQLISFLQAASAQQAAIEQTRKQLRDRHPTVLQGLRHLRLELDADFSDENHSYSSGRDVDFDRLLDPGDENFGEETFSFFGSETERTTHMSRSTTRRSGGSDQPSVNPGNYSQWTSGRLKSSPYSDTESLFIPFKQEASESSTGNVYSIPVWIGTGTIGPHAAVNEYMWNLQDPSLRNNVGPATPSHVAAGVPAMTYIFYDAWDSMLFPRDIDAAVKCCSLSSLRDVAAAIKTYRLKTRGTSDHWNGHIELVRTAQSARYQASEYWR